MKNSELELTDIESKVKSDYPYPIASVFDSFLAESHKLGRFIRFIDVCEVTIKYLASILLSDYLRSGMQVLEINNLLASALSRPSLGHWNNFVRSILSQASGSGNTLFIPDLWGFYFKTTTSGKKKPSPNQHFINQIISVRNEFAHGARPDNEECRQKVSHYQPGLNKLLENLEFLTRYPLVLARLGTDRRMFFERVMGSHDEFNTFEIESNQQWLPGQLYLASDNYCKWLSLHPFMVFEENRDNLPVSDLFFYDKRKRKTIVLLNYTTNTRLESPEFLADIVDLCPYLRLETIVSVGLLDTRELVARKVEFFVGRSFECDLVKRFIEKKSGGLILVWGPEDAGKTAFLAKIAHTNKVASYFNQPVKCTDETGLFLLNVCYQLNEIYNIGETISRNMFSLKLLLPLLIQKAAEKAGEEHESVIMLIDDIFLKPEILELFAFTWPENFMVVASTEEEPGESGDEHFKIIETIQLNSLPPAEVKEVLIKAFTRYEIPLEDVDQVLENLGSDLIYINTLIGDLKAGRLDAGSIMDLTGSIENLFEKQWEDYVGEDQTGNLHLLLGVLEVSPRSLSVEDLGEILELKEVTLLMELGQVRPWLREDWVDGQARYSLINPALRHFVHDKLDRDVAAGALDRIIRYYANWENAVDDASFEHLSELLYKAGRTACLKKLLLSPFILEKLKRTQSFLGCLKDIELLIAICRTEGDWPVAIAMSYLKSCFQSSASYSVSSGLVDVLVSLGRVDQARMYLNVVRSSYLKARVMLQMAGQEYSLDRDKAVEWVEKAVSLIDIIDDRDEKILAVNELLEVLVNKDLETTVSLAERYSEEITVESVSLLCKELCKNGDLEQLIELSHGHPLILGDIALSLAPDDSERAFRVLSAVADSCPKEIAWYCLKVYQILGNQERFLDHAFTFLPGKTREKIIEAFIDFERDILPSVRERLIQIFDTGHQADDVDSLTGQLTRDSVLARLQMSTTPEKTSELLLSCRNLSKKRSGRSISLSIMKGFLGIVLALCEKVRLPELLTLSIEECMQFFEFKLEQRGFQRTEALEKYLRALSHQDMEKALKIIDGKKNEDVKTRLFDSLKYSLAGLSGDELQVVLKPYIECEEAARMLTGVGLLVLARDPGTALWIADNVPSGTANELFEPVACCQAPDDVETALSIAEKIDYSFRSFDEPLEEDDDIIRMRCLETVVARASSLALFKKYLGSLENEKMEDALLYALRIREWKDDPLTLIKTILTEPFTLQSSTLLKKALVDNEHKLPATFSSILDDLLWQPILSSMIMPSEQLKMVRLSLAQGILVRNHGYLREFIREWPGETWESIVIPLLAPLASQAYAASTNIMKEIDWENIDRKTFCESIRALIENSPELGIEVLGSVDRLPDWVNFEALGAFRKVKIAQEKTAEKLLSWVKPVLETSTGQEMIGTEYRPVVIAELGRVVAEVCPDEAAKLAQESFQAVQSVSSESRDDMYKELAVILASCSPDLAEKALSKIKEERTWTIHEASTVMAASDFERAVRLVDQIGDRFDREKYMSDLFEFDDTVFEEAAAMRSMGLNRLDAASLMTVLKLVKSKLNEFDYQDCAFKAAKFVCTKDLNLAMTIIKDLTPTQGDVEFLYPLYLRVADHLAEDNPEEALKYLDRVRPETLFGFSPWDKGVVAARVAGPLLEKNAEAGHNLVNRILKDIESEEDEILKEGWDDTRGELAISLASYDQNQCKEILMKIRDREKRNSYLDRTTRTLDSRDAAFALHLINLITDDETRNHALISHTKRITDGLLETMCALEVNRDFFILMLHELLASGVPDFPFKTLLEIFKKVERVNEICATALKEG